jgi:hypothetical protein
MHTHKCHTKFECERTQGSFVPSATCAVVGDGAGRLSWQSVDVVDAYATNPSLTYGLTGSTKSSRVEDLPPSPKYQPRFRACLDLPGRNQTGICFGEICASPNVEHHSLKTESVVKELLLNIPSGAKGGPLRHNSLEQVFLPRRVASTGPVSLYGCWVQGLLEASYGQWLTPFGCRGWGAGGSIGCLTVCNCMFTQSIAALAMRGHVAIHALQPNYVQTLSFLNTKV